MKPSDGVPLKTWRAVVEVPAPCETVFKKLWNKRYVMFKEGRREGDRETERKRERETDRQREREREREVYTDCVYQLV